MNVTVDGIVIVVSPSSFANIFDPISFNPLIKWIEVKEVQYENTLPPNYIISVLRVLK